MTDQITVQPKTESDAPSTASEQQNVNQGRKQLISLCAAVLAVSFFLPWAQFLGATISGFDLQKLGDFHLLLWLIPASCGITIIGGFVKEGQNGAACVTGLLPFITAVYWFTQLGSDLLHMLTYGGYLSLICGAALIFLPRQSK